MIKLSTLNNTIFFTLLFSPLLAYIYTAYLKLPKDITVFFVYLVFIYGLFYLLFKNSISYPKFTRLMFLWALYFIFFEIILFRERHVLTQVFHYLKFISVFFISVIIYNTKFSDKFVKASVLIIKITIILTVIGSIIQVFNPEFLSAEVVKGEDLNLLNDSRDLYRLRRSSIYSMIHLGALGLSFIPLLAVLIGYMLKNGSKNYIIFLIMGGTSAFLSNTRFVMVGFLIITMQVLVYNKMSKIAFFKYALIALSVAIFSFYFLSYIGYDFQDWIDERLLAEGSLEETTRYKSIDNFLFFFPQRPIFGHGEMTEEIVAASRAVGSSHIHVGYLSHLVAFGIVGCFFLFGGWYLLAKRLLSTAKSTRYWGSFFAFLTFFWSFATMSQSMIFYYGLIFAMVFDKYFRDKYSETITCNTPTKNLEYRFSKV